MDRSLLTITRIKTNWKDYKWSHGCRAREWVRQAFRDSVDVSEYEFLSILEDKGMTFVFGINEIPIKFFKDDANNPSQRVRKSSVSEDQKIPLFEFYGIEAPEYVTESVTEDIMWIFIVELNDDSEVIKIVFLGLDNYEKTLCYYNVPLQECVAKIHDTDYREEEGIELPPAPASAYKKEEKSLDEVESE